MQGDGKKAEGGPNSNSSTSTNTTNASSVLDFLQICGKLKTTKRTGWVNHKVALPESISDHMYRMGIISFLFDASNNNLNRERMIKMALVHDMAGV